jgi:hypothetical protein
MKQEANNTYEGWANYETWVVNLSIVNDRASNAHWQDRACKILGDQPRVEDAHSAAAVQLAEEIRDAIEELCEIQNTGVAADLMNAALSKVDWFEIAQLFIDRAEPPPTELPPLFSLGKIVATPGALEYVPPADRVIALLRHSRGDWGDTGPEDSADNELSLKDGFRLLSVYHTESKLKFWIITEADRSVTTILLPEEY